MVAVVPMTPIFPERVAAAAARAVGSSTPRKGTGERLPKVGGHGTDCAARRDDHFYVLREQEGRVLPGVAADGVAAARAVGHAAGVAEIDDCFIRHPGGELAHGGQAAEAGVKHADGPGIHAPASLHRSKASAISRSSRAEQERPQASHSFGYMLMEVKPGSVFSSLRMTSVSLRTKKSTRARPSQPRRR